MGLFLLEVRRSIMQLCRYPVEAVLSLAILGGMFFGLGAGASASSMPGVAGEHVAPLLVLSYIFWVLCMSLISGPAAEFETESQQGTIEQIFCSSLSPQRIILSRLAAGMTMTAIILMCVVTPMALVTGLTLTGFVLLLIALAGVSAAGFGLALAGLAMLLKKTRAMVLLTSLGLMSIILIDSGWGSDASAAWLALPLVPLISLAKAEVLQSAVVQPWQVMLLLAAAVGYFVLGMVAFRFLCNLARRAGTIGKY